MDKSIQSINAALVTSRWRPDKNTLETELTDNLDRCERECKRALVYAL